MGLCTHVPVRHKSTCVCVMSDKAWRRVAQLKGAVEVMDEFYLRPANDGAIPDHQKPGVSEVSHVEDTLLAVQGEDARSATA